MLVLGSGPIRIGQGVEFDYCSVHCTWSFAKEGWETIIVNNNPETVSTDFDIADKLYFEPLTAEDVESIVNIEKPDGAVVQFGGQTAIKLTEALMKMGVKILGTKAEDVDAAEDRELFDEILQKTGIPRAAGGTVFTAEEAKKVANEIGYPVLVRPSYVLGGQGMKIAWNDDEIEEFIGIINTITQDHPILVDKYLMGKEIEVDAICDGTDILIPGIMEHIERTGVHSGDSISVYPAHTISEKAKETLVEYTKRLAQALHVVGMINIQFIDMDDNIYVIEVNPRSSRTVPYISKVTGIPIVDLAARIIMGETIKGMGYTPGLAPTADYIAIKMPVFSFEKLRGAEISLGPEKKVLKGQGKRVALMDFGAKNNIAKSLNERGCEVTIYPAHTTAEEILGDNPDGIMLSNGPGDPKECVEIIKEIKKLYDSNVPIFAICLGHQLMALATGADTHKMKYGHRGGNHPVKDLATGRVYISSQNHGYVVDTDKLDPNVAEPAFINVNDGTNEGLKYVNKNIFTVQFHPEACPGPQDSAYLFDRFINMMGGNQ